MYNILQNTQKSAVFWKICKENSKPVNLKGAMIVVLSADILVIKVIK